MSKVAILGSQTSEDLFGKDVSPIGKTIRINGISFNVIGLMESKRRERPDESG